MKEERPIIMSDDNPKLILEGRKTQTRRLVKEEFSYCDGGAGDDKFLEEFTAQHCPYGVAGDRLWLITIKPAQSEPPNMPRWASRITLEILKVRVERLQDISQLDCDKEGFRAGYRGRALFRAHWDSLHGKGAWDENPWVWVLEFKKQ